LRGGAKLGAEIPEGYKDTKVGVIPEEWGVVKLEGICDRITDGSHSSPKENCDEGYKIATVANMGYNGFDLDSCKSISKQEYEQLVRNGCNPNIGDILFSKDGTVGLCFVHKQNASLVLLSSIAIISPKKGVLDPDFGSYVLKSALVLRRITGQKTGSAISRIVLKDLKKIRILLPSPPEQRKIATILCSVDDAIQETGAIISQTEQVKRGLMQELFTKGIGHTEFQDTKIPDGWRSCKLDNIIDLVYGSGLSEANRMPGFSPVYGSNGIIGYHENALVKGPGIIIGRKGSIGEVTWCNEDFWPIDTTYYVKTKSNINLKWIYFSLILLNIKRLNSATGIPGLNRSDILSLRVFVPPLPEQRKIASILSSVDEKLEAERGHRAQLETMKKGLMQNLLTGKKRVKVDDHA